MKMKEQPTHETKEDETKRSKKESLRKDLTQKLDQLFKDVCIDHKDEDQAQTLDRKYNPIEKAFSIYHSDKSSFEDLLPAEICELLFEKNDQLNFSVIMSRKKLTGTEGFSLTITANANDNSNHDRKKNNMYKAPEKLKQTIKIKAEEAQVTCEPTTDLSKPFFTATNRGPVELITKFGAKEINQDKYLCLGLIELAGELAVTKGLILSGIDNNI